MRYLLFISSLFCLLLSAQAQKQRFNVDSLFLKRGSIGVEVGLAQPLFDYGATGTGSSDQYARTGAFIKVGFGYDLGRNINLKVQYLYAQNAVNTDAMYTTIKSEEPGTTVNPLKSINVSGPLTLSGIFSGLAYPLRVSNTTYEVRFMMGLLGGRVPEFTFNHDDLNSGGELTIVLNELNATGVGYTGGVGVKHQLKGNLLITAGLDVLYSEITYKNRTATFEQLNSFTPLEDKTIYYQLFHASVGLALQFN